MSEEYKDGNLYVTTDWWDNLNRKTRKWSMKARINFFAEILDEISDKLSFEVIQSKYAEKIWNNLNDTNRGEFLESLYGKFVYNDDWWDIGNEDNGYFPVIYFMHDEYFTSVNFKTIDPRKYDATSLNYTLKSYLEKLQDFKIFVDKKELNNNQKMLHIVVPAGTSSQVDQKSLVEAAEGVTIVVEEF